MRYSGDQSTKQKFGVEKCNLSLNIELDKKSIKIGGKILNSTKMNEYLVLKVDVVNIYRCSVHIPYRSEDI